MNTPFSAPPLMHRLLMATLLAASLSSAAAQDASDSDDRWQRRAARVKALEMQSDLPRTEDSRMQRQTIEVAPPVPRPVPHFDRPAPRPAPSAPLPELPRGMDERHENWGSLAHQQLDRGAAMPPSAATGGLIETRRIEPPLSERSRPEPSPAAPLSHAARPQRDPAEPTSTVPVAESADIQPERALPQRSPFEQQRVELRREQSRPPGTADRTHAEAGARPGNVVDWAIQQAMQRENGNPPSYPQRPPSDSDRQDRPRDAHNRHDDSATSLPEWERQHRIEEQRRQREQWEREEARRHADYERMRQSLERERRLAQYRYQQEYWMRWLQAQSRWPRDSFGFYDDPFFYAPNVYRIRIEDRWYPTNSYGIELLRDAVRLGYREGWYAGRADRLDRWRFDYRRNYAWIDGSLGYPGYYVSFDIYRYYFRQGFERGYRDGYSGRYRYGYVNADGVDILPGVLGMVLTFSLVH